MPPPHPPTSSCDVAIIGGGPGGSTTGALLKKHAPDLDVLILERERFPRDHVGESQLPPIGDVLAEMGCWDRVEAAGFPIKVGATFRWGRTGELWDFEFLPLDQFKDEPRPARYEGQRRQTAFQVDRAIYDQILLRRAEELGCRVREQTAVRTVERDGDRVRALVLADGERVRARHYVDASGHAGILRRSMGVATSAPTSLQNIAIWDYWENAAWAVEIGVGGTRIQILSQPHGWLWFIPLGPTRTSIGFVCPVEHYKSLGRRPEELYHEVVRADARVAGLIAGGTCRGRVETTKDWSFVSERAHGPDWFLVGESVGFADPILSAGLTLTHTGARELAYTIVALERGEHDAEWLKHHYSDTQQRRVRQHIRFADFWYACNGQFGDLREHCRKIAADAGLNLTADGAWRWLAQGGFTNDVLGQVGIGGFDLTGMKQLTQRFTRLPARWMLDQHNVFRLDLLGARKIDLPHYEDGRIRAVPCWVRGPYRLPMVGVFASLVEILRRSSDIGSIHATLTASLASRVGPQHMEVALAHYIQTLEVMCNDGWVKSRLDPRRPRLRVSTPDEGRMIHSNRDPRPGSPGRAEG